MHLLIIADVKETVSIKEEFTVDEDLTIEGIVEGKIQLDNHNLWIGSQGKVSATFHAKSLIVAGHVVGNIPIG